MNGMLKELKQESTPNITLTTSIRSIIGLDQEELYLLMVDCEIVRQLTIAHETNNLHSRISVSISMETLFARE